MAFRCGTCNKFRSLKDADVEVEVSDYEYDPEEGIAKLNMGINRLCPECGETFAVAAEVELEIEVPADKWKAALDEAEWEQA